MNDNYKNWDVSKGDYNKEHDNPEKYFYSYKTKKRLSSLSKLLLGIGVVVILVVVVFAAILT